MTLSPSSTLQTVLDVRGISKAFGANTVLRDVSFSLAAGEVLALVGENGAGKSTLMNIISGGLRYDDGLIRLMDTDYRPASPYEAIQKGVAIAHQETTTIPDLTVAENIFFGREPRNRFGLIQQSKLHAACDTLLAGLGFSIPAHRMGSDLSAAERQMVEIAKAMHLEPKILVLDEPTASLSSQSSEMVLALMQTLKERGTAIVFISHRLGEIMSAADRVIVLKDGELTLEATRGAFSRDDLVHAMVGRKLSNIFPARPDNIASAQPRLELGCAGNSDLPPISFSVRRGEILGIAGLEGQGQKQLSAALCGSKPFQTGKFCIDGKPEKISSVASAVALGIASIPDDRKREGLALGLPAYMNMSLFAISDKSRWGLLPLAAEKKFAEEARDRFNIRLHSLDQPVGQLSGGNQQKVVFARWLAHVPRVLVLFEPTKGVDVETKSQIYQLVSDLTLQGVSVILISSDLLELIGLSDRILTLYEGRISGEIMREKFSEEIIMQYATSAANEPEASRA